MDAPGVDSRNTATAAGLYFAVGEVGGVLGPTVMGIIADATGGFAGALVAMAFIAAFLVLMTVQLRRSLARASALP